MEKPDAPGGPGIPPTWTSSAKDMVSTALGSSRLWASFGHGIVNEVYWPSTGLPQIRDLGFIVAREGGWVEVKRARRYVLSTPKPYVPLLNVVHEGDDYRLELEYLPHPWRDALVIRYKLDGEGQQLYALLAPHMAGKRHDNTCWAGGDLLAAADGVAVCLQSDSGFARTSAGYVGVSDGWQDFSQNGAMTWQYGKAGNGNVALTGELAEQTGTLVLSFAGTPEGARTLGRASLAEDYETVRQTFIDAWEEWGKTIEVPYASPELRYQAELSAMVLKVHQDRTFAGSIIASLSVPWGNSHDSLGGYHLVWPRDAVQGALALMAIGQTQDARRMLAYLVGTQAESGAWGQNYFPDGRSYWTGHQLDEVALPVVLVGKLRAAGAVIPSRPIETMVRSAVRFIVQNGPMTDQDRWEENSGATPFTLAFAITALVASAEFLDPDEKAYVLSLADCWNERIEDWIYTKDGPLCAQYGVEGYYVRIAPLPRDGGIEGIVRVRNRANGDIAAKELVALDYLYLTRTGLRRAEDPRMLNTLKITDDLLGKKTPNGISYYRYNGDGYGEKANGAPYDGTGIGRPWPLLTGERGHFAACAGKEPFEYLDAIVKMAGPGGMLPEQIWDGAAIPQFELEPGKPSGSAMPLVWAHSEFIKLLATSATGQPAERLNVVESRYGGIRPEAETWHWRETSPFNAMPAGRSLLIEANEPFRLRFGLGGWDDPKEKASDELPLGTHGVRFEPERLEGVSKLVFTLYFTERDEWAGEDFIVVVEASA